MFSYQYPIALNSIMSPAVIATATVRVQLVAEVEVPMMMSSGWVWSEAEQCQPCAAAMPIEITVLPVVAVAVVNCPAVAPPTKLPSLSPLLEVKVVPPAKKPVAYKYPLKNAPPPLICNTSVPLE